MYVPGGNMARAMPQIQAHYDGRAKSRRENARSRWEGQLGCMIHSQLRWTRPLASDPWTCPPFSWRLRAAARRLAATELKS